MLGFNVIGLDVSKTALDFARKNIKKQKFYDQKHNYFFLLYGGGRFPLPSSSVHYIVTYDAFHHVPSQQRALDEMHRVLVPGGKVILSEPGEGHSQSEDTLAEVEKYGVLERDVCILDIERRAASAGFQNIYMKPFLSNISRNLSADDYHSLINGRIHFRLLKDIRDTLISNPFFILEKEGDLESSFALSSEISSDTTIIKCKPGSKIAFPLRLTNSGTRAYPHIEHENGGFVTIGKKLLLNGEMVDDDYGKRTILTSGIAPGESVDLKIKLTAPNKKGKYQLIVEPVLELFYWFSEKGCEPLKIDIVVE
jgi:SAM-dependent methyltransferase